MLDMEKKKERVLLLVIVIETVVVVSLGCLIALDKLVWNHDLSQNDPVQNGSQNDYPVEEEIEITDRLAYQISGILPESDGCEMGVYSHFRRDKTTANDFTNVEKNYIVAKNLLWRENLSWKEKDKTFWYDEVEIKNMKNRILGEDISFEIVDSNQCGYFRLEENGIYSVKAYCENTCSEHQQTKLIKAVKQGDRVFIEEAKIFEVTEKKPYIYYRDYDKKHFLFQARESYDTVLFDWDTYEIDADIYRYTFKHNEDDTYTFLKVEKTK